ncbi:MAG TPA: thioredoxin family protein [Bacteroidia bacterium]|jgi:thioredoxin 1|nr:thioredoxin family protein [Bacteroidia bacterium]
MSNFSELINSEQPILVDFSAKWWLPCELMEPVLKQVVANLKGGARIVKIDIDKNPAITEAYNINALPTFIVFKKGEIKWRQTGIVQRDQLTMILIYSDKIHYLISS